MSKGQREARDGQLDIWWREIHLPFGIACPLVIFQPKKIGHKIDLFNNLNKKALLWYYGTGGKSKQMKKIETQLQINVGSTHL